jgi:tRNA threonylcarbamoyladenosine biosynthesis protein TsaE
MKSLVSNSLAETQKIAATWLSDLLKTYSSTTQAAVIGLSGHLGAGKTTFVQAVAREMGVREDVLSPTFVLMKRYTTTNARWPYLVHIDAYRLEQPEELIALNWEALKNDPKNLIMVEWPENVKLECNHTVKFEQQCTQPPHITIYFGDLEH